MKKTILRLSLILLSMMLILVGCSSTKQDKNEEIDLLEQIQNRGVLVIGTEGTYSPNSYHDEADNLVGFDVEVGKKIAEYLGVKAEFFEAEWDSLFAAMDSGRVDTVINEVEFSEERAEKYDLSNPYTFVHGALLVLEEREDIQSFEDLSNKRTAQNLTSSWGRMAESYGAELVSIDTLSQVMDLLKTNRADATLNAETAFADYMKKHPDESVKIVALTESTSSSAVPVKKGEERLLQAINDALRQMKDSGELQELSIQYFGIDVTDQ